MGKHQGPCVDCGAPRGSRAQRCWPCAQAARGEARYGYQPTPATLAKLSAAARRRYAHVGQRRQLAADLRAAGQTQAAIAAALGVHVRTVRVYLAAFDEGRPA
jgi:DNA-binding NarL/FixJ family response regulator